MWTAKSRQEAVIKKGKSQELLYKKQPNGYFTEVLNTSNRQIPEL
jgi:hypothetical protein